MFEAIILSSAAVSGVYGLYSVFNSAVGYKPRIAGGISAGLTAANFGLLATGTSGSGAGMVLMVTVPILSAAAVIAASFCLGAASEGKRISLNFSHL